MKKTFMICVLIAGVLASTGCSGSRVKAPKEAVSYTHLDVYKRQLFG